ncbi:M48 family metallopeptidase [Actimicrobium sp. CCI2.3]|uniref:M48 family metallopeptidase n=1 Tax=Actimicrobium sp. CCI2.3 TaxID=3048616 RepID=UPI002B23F7F2|nr:M48 family metallopeptidase [Actimicrobium sp. CCI2.3]MEB0021581.1 M48 family metallopeptidase [Actimicrobium sp. CCI2.3]
MDFFEQQEQARRQTRTLLILFLLAVSAIVLSVNVAAALLWIAYQGGKFSAPHVYPAAFFFTNTALTLGLIGGGTLIELFNLREGGDAVAQRVGGRLVSRATSDPQERRLLNVVEEVALASAVACPKVYLLDREESINAFAAGYNPNEAVVAVTRGTLTRLTRDELQGVIAHEFSHILNGDMRMNVRLIGVLFGIQMLAGFGQQLMEFGGRVWGRSGRDEKGSSLQVVVFTAGLVLFVIGYIGIFFGRLIKSAVSRQREFLADASAVQFTRNPDGIGGALRKIGGLSRDDAPGSQISSPNAEQLSHLFLGAVRPSLVAGLFATHPTIAERLHRIFGRQVGMLDAPPLPLAEVVTARLPDLAFAPVSLAAAMDGVTLTVSSATAALPPSSGSPALPWASADLDRAVRDPHAARALVFALLLDEGAQHTVQQAILDACPSPQTALAIHLAQQIAVLPAIARLPLLDLAMPALKQLSPPERAQLLVTVGALIAADQRVTLAEFVLQTILVRRLHPHAGRSVPVRFDQLGMLRGEVALLLSLLAHHAVSGSAAPIDGFLRGTQRCPELALAASDFRSVERIDFDQVRDALGHLLQLAPLAKPALLKALVAVASETDAGPLPANVADLLRAVCSAIDAPLPPAVAASYPGFHVNPF